MKAAQPLFFLEEPLGRTASVSTVPRGKLVTGKVKSPLCVCNRGVILHSVSQGADWAWLGLRPGRVGSGWMLRGDGSEKVVSPDLFSTEDILGILNTVFSVEVLLIRLTNWILNSQVHAVEWYRPVAFPWAKVWCWPQSTSAPHPKPASSVKTVFHSKTNYQVTAWIAVVKNTAGEEEMLPSKVILANLILKSTQDRWTREK